MKTLTSKLLSAHTNVLHAFTTRSHKTSKYGNNLAYHVNDDPIHVDENHKRLAAHLHYPLERLVHMNQVHGDKCVIINERHDYQEIKTCDALITQQKGIPLMVMVADCNPILMYDPIQGVIAAVHAGRAGIFSNILSKTIKKMHEAYGSDPKDMIVSIGPSIHQCCYQVGNEVNNEAHTFGFDYAIQTNERGYYLDLVAIAHRQLKEVGVEKKNIETSTFCTACHTDIFYSYRAENNQCGRFAGVIMLK